MKIFVTRKIPEAGIKMLRQKGYEVEVSPYGRVLKAEEIIKMGKGSDALLCLLTDKITDKVMQGLGSQLKIIANYAVGFDNIDKDSAKKRKIMVSNTPGVLTETVAEHAVALIFAVARRIAESDRFVRAGKYKGWEPELLLGSDVGGKTLGVVGLGRIGRTVAERMKKGFGVKVLYYDKFRNEEAEKKLGIKYANLPSLLKASDFITIHVPLLSGTRHLINEKALKSMKKTAYLINTSRGPVVDEKALVQALKNNWIRGAGLDVFEEEPKLAPGLADLRNVTITPHTASATVEARSKMAELAAENIIAALSGKKPPSLIY